MTVTDDTIRQAVRDAIPATRPSGITELESSIESRIVRHHRRRVATLGTVAALLVLLLVSAALVASGRDDTHEEVVAGPPGTSMAAEDAGFSDFGPGWHELDPGPVPPSDQTSTAWTGTELIVSADLQTFAYDPATKAWRTLGALPFDDGEHGNLVWTGTDLVAVSFGTSSGRSEAAVLDPAATAGWTEIAGPETAPGLQAVGSLGPGAAGWSGLALAWTGERVIDVTHGAVLDPESWTWSTLPFPENLMAYMQLLYTNPVWDGSEVVLAAATTGAGLAWTADGSAYRELPGIPGELLPSTGSVFPAVAMSPAAGTVVVVSSAPTSAAGDTNIWQLDTASDIWTKLPTAPDMTQMEGCPGNAAALPGRPLVAGCSRDGDIHQLAGGVWSGTGQPTGQPWISAGTWLPAGEALVTWISSTDTTNDPQAPFTEAWVWVPPSS